MNIDTASALFRQKPTHPEFQWVDVRSATEYASGHIPGTVNIPLEQIEARLDDLLPNVPIVLVCQAGKRARMVAGLLEPCRKDVSVLEGGTAAWGAAGLPLVVSTKSRWSLERQVRLVAGLLILMALVLAATVHRYWLGLAGFVGLGLTFAGITDLCLMGALLVRLPWNRTRCAPNTLDKQICRL
jgi:rhodanese-related sulfurtransferase